jgi:hypothetical protein
MPAATPRLALPYPIPDDSVDVPRDVQALAMKLDANPDIDPVVVTGTPPTTAQGSQVGDRILWQPAGGSWAGLPPWTLVRRSSAEWTVLAAPPVFLEASSVAVPGGNQSWYYADKSFTWPTNIATMTALVVLSGGAVNKVAVINQVNTYPFANGVLMAGGGFQTIFLPAQIDTQMALAGTFAPTHGAGVVMTVGHRSYTSGKVDVVPKLLGQPLSLASS